MNNLMNQCQLSKEWQDKLSQLPESGMGYQEVAVNLVNGTVTNGIVLNGQTLETIQKVQESDIADIVVKKSNTYG